MTAKFNFIYCFLFSYLQPFVLTTAATSITCENSQMVVSLNSSYVADGRSSDVHLLDPSCTGQAYDNETIQLVTDFDRCGTTMTASSP